MRPRLFCALFKLDHQSQLQASLGCHETLTTGDLCYEASRSIFSWTRGILRTNSSFICFEMRRALFLVPSGWSLFITERLLLHRCIFSPYKCLLACRLTVRPEFPTPVHCSRPATAPTSLASWDIVAGGTVRGWLASAIHIIFSTRSSSRRYDCARE